MAKCKEQTQNLGLYQSEYEHDACGVGPWRRDTRQDR